MRRAPAGVVSRLKFSVTNQSNFSVASQLLPYPAILNLHELNRNKLFLNRTRKDSNFKRPPIYATLFQIENCCQVPQPIDKWMYFSGQSIQESHFGPASRPISVLEGIGDP